jgi:nucleoside-diphosphate-sugar epimerase
MAKLIVGCGYLGGRVARQWQDAGEEVFAVVHNPDHAEPLRRAGLRPIVADVTRPETLVGLPPCTTVVFAVGYSPRSGGSRRELYVDGLRNVLDAVSPDTQRVIHISSTGVYGQTDGRWIDEDTPCRPRREGGQTFLAAERLLAEHRLGPGAVSLRLSGLYGPGRIPLKTDLLAGRPIAVQAEVYLNLIHVDDAARVVLAAERARPPRVYNVADGQPVLRREYFRYLGGMLGVRQVEFVDPPPDAPLSPRSDSNKRISPARMMAELNVRLAYPSYREGLAAIVGGGDGSS